MIHFFRRCQPRNNIVGLARCDDEIFSFEMIQHFPSASSLSKLLFDNFTSLLRFSFKGDMEASESIVNRVIDDP